MSNTVNTNREIAQENIIALSTALADCGIESTITIKPDTISLDAMLWSCVDDNDVHFGVWAEESTDYEIEHYAEPLAQTKEFFKEIENL